MQQKSHLNSRLIAEGDFRENVLRRKRTSTQPQVTPKWKLAVSVAKVWHLVTRTGG